MTASDAQRLQIVNISLPSSVEDCVIFHLLISFSTVVGHRLYFVFVVLVSRAIYILQSIMWFLDKYQFFSVQATFNNNLLLFCVHYGCWWVVQKLNFFSSVWAVVSPAYATLCFKSEVFNCLLGRIYPVVFCHHIISDLSFLCLSSILCCFDVLGFHHRYPVYGSAKIFI